MYYLLAHIIDPLEVGSVVSRLPLHMSLVHWFSTNAPFSQIDTKLQDALKSQKTMTLSVGDEDFFGPDKNILVNKITKEKELINTHKAIIQALSYLNITHTNPEWTNDGWNPHVTHQKNRHLNKDDKFLFNSVSLIASDNYGGGSRKILDTINLQQ